MPSPIRVSVSYCANAALPPSMIVDVSVIVIVWAVVLRKTVTLPAVAHPVTADVPTVPDAAIGITV